jgi:hypothetical protein
LVFDVRMANIPEDPLELVDPKRETTAMNRKELEERVDEILLKRTRGEKLTRQEETILAYTYHAASQRRTSIWLRPPKRT